MTKRISKLQRFSDGIKYQQMVNWLRYVQRRGIEDPAIVSTTLDAYDLEIEKIKKEYGEKVIVGYKHERSKLAKKLGELK